MSLISKPKIEDYSSSNLLQAIIFFGLAIISSAFIIIRFNGLGAEADSYSHFLIARFAPQHPFLYFDHWGKPVFTLLASPFAQFGLIGIKIFNQICHLSAIWLSFLYLKQRQFAFAQWIIPIYYCIPLAFITTFGGFTEPLFALALIAAIYLISKNHWIVAAILVSFFPLIRSEGLILLPVFFLLFIWERKLILTPLFLCGNLIYSLMGAVFFDKSFLWIFNEIPYASIESPYGKGNWLHFPEQLYYILGLPLLILFLVGIIRALINFRSLSRSELILIYGGFFAFFLFHQISWKFGLFNSMGLKRVFAAIFPLLAIICFHGLLFIDRIIERQSIKKVINPLLVLIIALFLFSKNPSAIDWNSEMNLSSRQEMAMKVGTYIKSHGLKYRRLLFNHKLIGHQLKIDPFDPEEFKELSVESLNDLKKNDLVIWDNWHSVIDRKIDLKLLENDPTLSQLKIFFEENDDQTLKYVIFKKN